MKLLFDHNLSPKLVIRLNDLYSNSNHLYLMNLDKEPDYIIWGIAKTENYTIVTKDSDFNELLILKGFPPKVISPIRCLIFWQIMLITSLQK
jgi:predicted nuclease of predicted toxin-antitoxin system